MQDTVKLEEVVVRHSAVGSVVLGLLIVGAGATPSRAPVAGLSRYAADVTARPVRLMQPEAATPGFTTVAFGPPAAFPGTRLEPALSLAPMQPEIAKSQTLVHAVALPRRRPRPIAASFAAPVRIPAPALPASTSKIALASSSDSSETPPATLLPQPAAPTQASPATTDIALNEAGSAKAAELVAPGSTAPRDPVPTGAVPAPAGLEKDAIAPAPKSAGPDSMVGLTPAASPAPVPEPAQPPMTALAPTETAHPARLTAVKFDLAAVTAATQRERSRSSASARAVTVGSGAKLTTSPHRVPSSRMEPLPRTSVKAPLSGHYRTTPRGLEFDIAASVNGTVGGKLPLLVDSSDHLSVRLADVLALVRPLMDPQLFADLAASSNAQEYVSFETLRSSGIDVRYDAGRNELALGSAKND